MGKGLDEDIMGKMSVIERFNYVAAKKKMLLNTKSNNTTCSYSGLPSMEVYQDEPEASLEEQAKHTNWEDEWVDRDESEWDSSSDGRSKRGSTSYDDSNEY